MQHMYHKIVSSRSNGILSRHCHNLASRQPGSLSWNCEGQRRRAFFGRPYTAESNLELGRLPCSADLGDRRPVSMASPCSLTSIESIFMYIIINYILQHMYQYDRALLRLSTKRTTQPLRK
jgi:hypothetical protein